MMLLNAMNASALIQRCRFLLLHRAPRCRVLWFTKLFQNVPLHDRKVRVGQLLTSCVLPAFARMRPHMPFQGTLCRPAGFPKAPVGRKSLHYDFGQAQRLVTMPVAGFQQLAQNAAV
jgi:hypothetical protein